MADRIPLPSLPGSLDAFVGVDVKVSDIAADATISFIYGATISPAVSGDVVIEFRSEPGGAGRLLATLTIVNGEKEGSWTGAADVTAGESVWYWVTSGGGALEFSGYLELDAAVTFTTLERVKDHANITTSELDGLIVSMIGARTRAMQRWMRSNVLQKAHTEERYDGRDGWANGTLQLAEAPWQSVSEVKENDTVLVEDEDFVLEKDLGELRRGTWRTSLPWLGREIRVTGISGYPSSPEDLTQACTEQVRHDLTQAQQGGDRIGETSRAFPEGGQTTFLQGGWLPSVVEVMSTYRETARGR